MNNKSALPHRTVRSFVRREGRITRAQTFALEQLEPRYTLHRPWNTYTELFGRSAPVELEIGCGNGEAMLQMAAQRPEHDFIGIEVYRPGLGNLLKGLEQAQLTNIRVSSNDAIEIVRDVIPARSLHRIMIFFPDPWPKKKHHKRRIVNTDSLTLFASRLLPGGELHIATDWRDYAEWIYEAALNCDAVTDPEPLDASRPRPEHRPLTKYEQRGLKLGHDVFDILLRPAT